MNNLEKLTRIHISPSQRNNRCYKQWGSCTRPDRGWTPWECQLARADQNRDQSIKLQCHTARREVSTNAPNKTSEDRHIFGVKKNSLHTQKLDEEFKKLTRIHISPSQRNNRCYKQWDHAHFQIEGGQFENANWFVHTKIGIDRLVCNDIQLVTRCPPTPQTKHQKIVTSSG